MNLTKNVFLPVGLALLVGACSPFYPQPHPNTPNAAQNQQTLTDEQQRLLAESQAGATNPDGQPQTGIDNNALNPSNTGGAPTPAINPNTGRPDYPTASPVPGKPGFVFNPWTHNIVDVKGIAPGKLCRDPEDADVTHKFRVP